MKHDQLRRLCLTAVFTAITVVMSSFGIPVPGGHLYLNDVIICTAALLLDPLCACAVGGIGAFLGDFFFYPTPMFVSLAVHGAQSLVIALLANKRGKGELSRAVIGLILGAIIAIVGYSLGRAYLYATPEIALLKLPYQIAQAVIGAVFGGVICFATPIKKFRIRQE